MFERRAYPGGTQMWWTETVTTTTELVPVNEERMRQIAREELADLIPIDVPDTLPDEAEDA